MLLRHFCCHGWEKRLKPTGECGMTSHPVPSHPVSCHFRCYNDVTSGAVREKTEYDGKVEYDVTSGTITSGVTSLPVVS